MSRIKMLWLLTISLLFSLPVQAQLVVLQYHHVSADTPPVTSVTPAQFEQHLQLIEQLQLPVVDLVSALQQLDNGQTLPDGAVAISFDDAYLSIYQHALPALEKRRWPFVVFVNTGAVDQQHQGVMSWQQLRDLKRRGATLANHSVDHPYLIERPSNSSLTQWLEQQITQAQQRLEQETGATPKLFAYPYGEFDVAITNWLQQQGYKSFGQQSGPIGRFSHPQLLPRFPASGIYANPETLANKLRTLPVTLKQATLPSPLLTDNPPTIRLTIDTDAVDASEFQCFASGQGAISTHNDRKADLWQVEATAASAINSGRFRYNCTAPSQQKPGWFYWHSQVWINPAIHPR